MSATTPSSPISSAKLGEAAGRAKDPFIPSCLRLIDDFGAASVMHANHRNVKHLADLRDKRMVAWLAFANTLISDLSVLRPHAMQTRPATLPNSDLLVWSALKNVAKMSARASKEHIEIAHDFYAWRQKMMGFESSCRSKLESVIETLHWIEQIPDDGVKHISSELRSYVAAQYGFGLPAQMPDNALDRKELAIKHTTYTADFPLWMRSMTKPPGCYPGSEPDEPKHEED